MLHDDASPLFFWFYINKVSTYVPMWLKLSLHFIA
jgi:hypothetical protein